MTEQITSNVEEVVKETPKTETNNKEETKVDTAKEEKATVEDSAVTDEDGITVPFSKFETVKKASREWQSRAENNQKELFRYKAAAKHGISEEDLVFLVGNNEEEINKNAERFAERIKTSTTTNNTNKSFSLQNTEDTAGEMSSLEKKLAEKLNQKF